MSWLDDHEVVWKDPKPITLEAVAEHDPAVRAWLEAYQEQVTMLDEGLVAESPLHSRPIDPRGVE